MPILLTLIPTLVGIVENIIPKTGVNDSTKTEVMDLLGKLYDKYAAPHIPNLPGVDEKAIALDILSFVYDQAVKKFA